MKPAPILALGLILLCRASIADPVAGGTSTDGFLLIDDSLEGAADLVEDLGDLGYVVTVETPGETEPDTWESYDLLIGSGGENSDAFRANWLHCALRRYVRGGGNLLLEGGRVGWNASGEGGNKLYARNVPHTDYCLYPSAVGNLTVVDPEHPAMSVPNLLPLEIPGSWGGWTDQDALTPTADADLIASWTAFAENDYSSIIAFDPNTGPEGGQTLFFSFNYADMDAGIRPLLLENAVTWLTVPEVGDAGVGGSVFLAGMSDHSGVKVEVLPSGMSSSGPVYTTASGAYDLDEVFHGEVTIQASKDGWSREQTPLTLDPGEQATGIDFLLNPADLHERCDSLHLYIPEWNIGGNDVSAYMEVDLQGIVSTVEVYVDVTLEYDLDVLLYSPEGTPVKVHETYTNTCDGNSSGLIGWFPSELEPWGDLDLLRGQTTDGTWRLTIRNHAPWSGWLNAWCLRIVHVSETTDVLDGTAGPMELLLRPNVPNPLHEMTAIRFDLARSGPVDLTVFDLLGRRVKTLISATIDAGAHEAWWFGTDHAGRPVPSGLYFYRLEAGGRSLSRRMIRLE